MAKKPKTDIRIEPIEKGGFIVHHSSPSSMSGPFKEPKRYAFDNHKDMVEHVTKATAAKKPRTFREALDSLKKR